MVKPPTTMQPEAVNLEKAGRAAGKSFQVDSFHNYMARKIDLQRKQFGLVLPPKPPEERNVHFAPDTIIENHHCSHHSKSKKKKRKSGLARVLKKLKRRHGRAKKRRDDDDDDDDVCVVDTEDVETRPLHEDSETTNDNAQSASTIADSQERGGARADDNKQDALATECVPSISKNSPKSSPLESTSASRRPDLFFLGVVVQVNGYTNPDTETLQRMLHKHGGDLEKYETSRVTHIIAEHLSTAKAKIYKQRRRPIPVCYPAWILDSVKAMKLLPHGKYLIDEVRDSATATPSVASFLKKGAPSVAAKVRQEHNSVQIQGRGVGTPSAESETIGATNNGALEAAALENGSAAGPSAALEKNTDLRGTSDSKAYCTENASLGKDDPSLNQLKSRSPNSLAGVQDLAISIQLAQWGVAGEELPNTPLPESGKGVCSSSDRKGAVDELETSKKDDTSAPETRGIVATGHGTKADGRYINGRVRTVGTDPNFLDSFFAASRLSFIGSFKQRAKQSPLKTASRSGKHHRYVFHVDMDCFFASVVLRNYPEYQDKPVAISHHGKSSSSEEQMPTSMDSTSECATCNYHAREYGIKKGMYLGRAKQLCPELVVLQYDFDGYEEVSEQVAEILARIADMFCGTVEQVSCDEAFIELFLDDETEESPKDRASAIAESIRDEILETTQCTATVGVASNKFLAKLATDRVKPNKSLVVDDYHELLQGLKLRDLHGIGYRSEGKLKGEGLNTVQDVLDLGDGGEGELCRILGPGLGKKVSDFCHGIDHRPVQPAERKTIGAECNYGVRFNGPYGVDHMILGLAKEVEKRMANVGVTGRKITVKLKQRKAGARPPPKFLGHGSCHNLSRSCDTPNMAATRDHGVIFKCCMTMFPELNVKDDDIRGMGIVVSKLSADNSEISRPHERPETSLLDWLHQRGSKIFTKDSASGASQQNDKVGPPASPSESSMIIAGETSETAAPEHDNDSSDEIIAVQSQYHDIDLPSLSQIHTSQVEVLPSPLKRKIMDKIDAADSKRLMIASDRAPSADDPSYRQVDMRRIMKLAALKSGEQQLPELKRLPLEIQLQVANSDNGRVGKVSGKRNSQQRQQGTNNGLVSPQKNIHRHQVVDLAGETCAPENNDADDTGRPDAGFQSGNFFVENVLPLSVFLDENSPSNTESLQYVVQFLEICMRERRFTDVVVLLRSIKNREDEWKERAFEKIFDVMNALSVDMLGEGLDRDWI